MKRLLLGVLAALLIPCSIAEGSQPMWRAPAPAPMGDLKAAQRVVHEAEVRPQNVDENRYVPTDSELQSFYRASTPDNTLTRYVTGRPGLTNPSTGDLIQWAAWKWGIPEDWIKAVAVIESSWRQDALGDREDGVDASLYPPQARIDSDSVYESMGITQIKWRPSNSPHPGTEPLRWKSTAFNLDYYGATIRYYYDGLCDWCSSGYTAGQAWNSIGAWYQPSPWLNFGQLNYITHVQDHLTNRDWESF
jgi:hypothetical protein